MTVEPTAERSAVRAAFSAALRAPTGSTPEADGGEGGASSPQELAMAALRKELAAAQAALGRAEREQAGEQVVQAARLRVTAAAQALSEALTRQAQQAAGPTGSGVSFVAYA
jgi:hypothetical protein